MSIRTERVARLIQREVANLLQTTFQEQVHRVLTVTGARITNDLSIAYIYVSVYGSGAGERQAAFSHVTGLAVQIRTALAARIRHQVRKIPELRFVLDETAEDMARFEDLFDKIREERGRREAS